MANISDWVVDANNDGYADDVTVRFVLELASVQADRAFLARLLDLTARVGLELHALPLPLCAAASGADFDAGWQQVAIRGVEDIPDVAGGARWEAAGSSPTGSVDVSPCLTRLFTVDGALEDRDGDLLPDASRITFVLPESIPAALGAALANLAARIGLESGGVTLPLVRDGGVRFDVRPGDGPAALRVLQGGWLAEGDPDELARLLNHVATDWPHVTAPELGGAGSAIATLRRWLAGDGPELHEPGEVIEEWEWSAEWEADAFMRAFGAEVLERLDLFEPDGPLDIVACLSEPPDQRQRLAERIRTAVADSGYRDATVTVLRSFKVGLSWLEEVVIPGLRGRPVQRVRIVYRRHEQEATLDLPIRWLQELFPGNEVIARELDIPVDAIEIVEGDAGMDVGFVAEAFGAHNRSLGRWRCWVPSRIARFVDALDDSEDVVVTTGGAIVRTGDAELTRFDVATDLERFWEFWRLEVLPALFEQIASQGGPHTAHQPFFSQLVAEVWISEPNEPLGVREENVSAAEALAEDIYFTTLDAIELHGRETTGEKLNAPGAVIPIVHVTPGEAPRARVTLRAAPARPDLPYPGVRVTVLRLDGDALAIDVAVEVEGDATGTRARLRDVAAMPPPAGPSIAANIHFAGDSIAMRLPLPAPLRTQDSGLGTEPPMDENIWGDAVIEHARRLAAFPEVTAWIEDQSYQARPIPALSLAAPTPGRLRSPVKSAIFKPTFLVVARHHANEISSTNAALRLAWLCAADPGWRRYLDRVNVLLIPYENPDGAALHAYLSSFPEARTWKHHPARYNALGSEFSEAMFDPDTRFGEARVRTAIWRRWPADVVVDNHGVPSHEWVQPFAGFGSPPRFKVSYWIVQAMLYGIVRYVDDERYPEHHLAALALRDAVSAKVRDTEIGEWNRVYGESYRFWGQARLPDRFPGEFHDDMLWHISSGPADPEGRGVATRYPKTTVLSWITEVNDETAEGEHLEQVARAHLLANQATLDLLYAAVPPVRRWRTDEEDGRYTLRVGRERPLRFGHGREG